jgi:hypothetical protein
MPSTRQGPDRRRERAEPEDLEPTPAAAGGGDELIDGVDDLLDEIDALLEEQSVLTNFRQRSGQ